MLERLLLFHQYIPRLLDSHFDLKDASKLCVDQKSLSSEDSLVSTKLMHAVCMNTVQLRTSVLTVYYNYVHSAVIELVHAAYSAQVTVLMYIRACALYTLLY
jgi:hypothetical protein